MLNCPNCEKQINDSEWFYNNDLYGQSDAKKVKCPNCDRHFMIESYETVGYNRCTIEDFEEDGEIF